MFEVTNSLSGKTSPQEIEVNTVVEEYIAVAFVGGPDPIIPDKEGIFELQLMYYPHPVYEKLKNGATFTIREGSKIVGFGLVVESEQNL